MARLYVLPPSLSLPSASFPSPFPPPSIRYWITPVLTNVHPPPSCREKTSQYDKQTTTRESELPGDYPRSPTDSKRVVT